MNTDGEFLKTETSKPSIKVPPREHKVWSTPMFDQYWAIRDSVKNLSQLILFYRMGDFYEIFGEDALKAAPVLGVLLTARHKDSDIPVPMCGVPVHSVDNYIEKLLAKNFKVAVCDQAQSPDSTETSKPKLIERKIIRILTPGLLTQVDGQKVEISYLLCVKHNNKGFQLNVFDYLGQKCFLGNDLLAADMKDLVQKISVSEILINNSDQKIFLDVFKNSSLKEKLEKKITLWPSSENVEKTLNEYLEFTQRTNSFSYQSFPIEKLVPTQTKQKAFVMPEVLEQWNILPELAHYLDGSSSVFGTRRLQSVLMQPLADFQSILKRQEAFRYVSKGRYISFLEHSSHVYDLERLLGRIQVGAAKYRELLKFVASLGAMKNALSCFDFQSNEWKEFEKSEGLKALSQHLVSLEALYGSLYSAVNLDVDPAELGGKSEDISLLIRDGYSPEYDELKKRALGLQDWLEEFENKLKQETDISSLKVRANRVFGFFIEVTKTHLSKVPDTFIRKQTTVGGERYSHPELLAREQEFEQSEKLLAEKSRAILDSCFSQIQKSALFLRELYESYSWVEMFAGVEKRISQVSGLKKWVFPTISESDFCFSIEEGRHPLVEKILGPQKSFIPQTLSLGGDENSKRLMLLTGPNMAGKSTLMRLIGIHLILAQTGFKVPAKAMSLSPAHSFFSRMGAHDRILEGESTFMVEMSETSKILKSADKNSFVLIDELGRGTSTEDGLSLASSVCEYLHDKNQSLTLFATHYHELSSKAETLPRLQNASMAIQEVQGDLVFLRQLQFKPAESSYGIFVARLAGLPHTVIQKAQALLKESLKKNKNQKVESLSLFEPVVETIVQDKTQDELLALDLDSMSPRDVWHWVESKQKQKNH